ncbi:hypothetical protein DR950_27960 [Kitasatospora xanthocidica]|uniref:Uncharacterized protein n=1 Tax=Kitasatospora xanthocidica TaxID=83382 RepID=A0A372ZZ25_9ACTN|nr:hypothetical protein [Kitasatospora xanthocidica]RGD61089.1 hypothetical protein DR950_27960 [Kitasatospora xanthocidica]
MLDQKLPWPLGGINIAPVVSTVQTNVSASDLVAAFGKQNVQVELDTLTTFVGKIEALLAAMEGSPAAPYKLQEQKLTGKSFASAEFAEATALTTAYGKVHAQLVQLHKDFVSQIQAMQTAVTRTASIYATNEDHTTAAQNAVAKNAGVTTSAPGSGDGKY